MLLPVLLTLLPIAVILVLMVRKNFSADSSGIIGWLLVILVAYLFFSTSLEVSFRSSIAGIVASFPVSLMVLASILQISFMEATGALRRVVVFVKTLAPSDQVVQIMLLNVGAGTLLVSVGATPVSILPPIMLSLGYSAFIAVALPSIGFDALCTFSLLGAPLVVFADLTGTSLIDSARVFAMYLPIISTMIGFGMLWLVGGFKLVRLGFVPCVIAGVTNGGTAIAMSYIPFLKNGVVLTGVVAGACTILVMLLYLKLLNKPIIDRSVLTKEDLAVEKEMSLFKAISPWIILVSVLLLINFYQPIFKLLFNVFEMPVSIIPGQVIKTRMLWNAYTWVIIATLFAGFVIKPDKNAVKNSLTKWLKRAPRPTISAAIFFAIAYVMNNSGAQNVGGAWKVVQPNSNMIHVLADASAATFGSLYPFISSYLGLLGGFISGSEASTIAMFTKYHILTSNNLSVDPLIVIAATAIGGGLASVISPAKLQNAAATIDATGIESKIIKTAFKVTVVITSICAIMTMLFIHIF